MSVGFIAVLTVLLLLSCCSAVRSFSRDQSVQLDLSHSAQQLTTAQLPGGFEDFFHSGLSQQQQQFRRRRRRKRTSVGRGVVYSVPEWLKEPESLVLPDSSVAQFHCRLNESAAGGKSPVKKVEWRKDGKLLDFTTTTDNRRRIYTNGTLVIEKLFHSVLDPDEGVYDCLITLEAGRILSRKATLKRAVVTVSKSHSFSNRTVEPDSFLVINCPVTTNFPVTVRWYRNQKEIHFRSDQDDNAPSHFTRIPTALSLEIKEVGDGDAGVYQCRIAFGLIAKTEATVDVINITVSSGDAITESADLEFEAEPQSVVVSEGQPVTLQCASNAFPEPEITWLKETKRFEPTDENITIVGQGSLVFSYATLEHSGLYTCHSENSENYEDRQARLTVQGLPRFKVRPASMVGAETEDVQFRCEVEGSPRPDVTWYRNGEILEPSDFYAVEDNNTLKIRGLVLNDAGIFQCFAENSVGSIQASAQLLVERSDYVDHLFIIYHGKNRTASQQQPNPSGTANDTDLITSTPVPLPTVFTSFGPNTEILTGPGNTRGPPPPSEPQRFRAQQVSARSVSLAWDSPVQTNGEILAFSLYYKQEGSDRERAINSTNGSLKITVEPLQSKTTYYFRVVAYNQNGPGLSSSPLRITTTEAVRKVKIEKFRAEPISSTGVLLRWDPLPSGPAEPPTVYKLLYSRLVDESEPEDRSTDSEEETEIELSESTYDLHGLEAFTAYSFRVEGHRKGKSTIRSDNVVVKTYSDIPSAPPSNVTAEPNSPTSVSLSWQQPHFRGRKGLIIGYKVRCKAKGKSPNTGKLFSIDGNVGTYTVNELAANTVYSVKIAAVNSNGTGPYTPWINVATLEEEVDETHVPGAPLQLQYQARSNSIVLAWVPPMDETVGIRGYIIGWGIGVPDVKTVQIDGKQRMYTIEELKPNKMYVISLKAFNKIGSGFPIYETVTTAKLSAPTEATLTPLQTPIGLRAATVSATGIKLTWTDRELPPVQNGENQFNLDGRRYMIRFSSMSVSHGKANFVNTSDTSYTVEKLRPHTQYDFSVKVVKDRRESEWSMTAINSTFVTVPQSSPRDLTVVRVEENPSAINLNWQPPRPANGPIIGYVLLWTNDNSKPDREWHYTTLSGDRLTTVVDNLVPETLYYFKMQARNDKGYGPMSVAVRYKTLKTTAQLGTGRQKTKADGVANIKFSGDSGSDKDGKMTEIIIIAIGSCVGVLLVVLAIVGAICLCRNRRQRDGYQAGVKKTPPTKDLATPDLWINHDHLKLRDRNPPESEMGSMQDLKISHDPTPPPSYNEMQRFDLPTHPQGYNTNSHTSSHNYNSLEGSHQGATMERRIGRAQPIMMSCQSSGDEGMGSGTISRSFLKNSSGDLSARSYQQRSRPAFGSVVYTGPKNQNIDELSPLRQSPFGSGSVGGLMTPPPPQIPLPQAGGGQSGRGMNPLSSFIISGAPPPPTGSPELGRHPVRSPFLSGYNNNPNLPVNRKPAGIVIGTKANGSRSVSMGSPRVALPSGCMSDSYSSSGKETDVDTLPYAYSTEELNVQMKNLDSLMKDLNSIAKNEFEDFSQNSNVFQC